MQLRYINEKLALDLQRSIEVSSEKGASTWLTTVPLSDHRYRFTLQLLKRWFSFNPT